MKKLLLFLLLFFLIKSPVFAQGGEVITNFNADITPNRNGVVSIIESITYDFGSNDRHGIFREIPLSGNSNTIDIKVEKVLRDELSEQYSVSSNKDISIKIGNPNKTINGLHKYTIFYKVGNSITHFKDHDELYWNVTGNGWPAPIQTVTTKISFSSPSAIIKIDCFTGYSGSTEKLCQIEDENGAKIISAKNLSTEQGLTIVIGFEPNIFPKTPVYVNPKKEMPTYLLALIFGAITLVSFLYYFLFPILILRWYLRNRRKRKYGPPAVNFDFPTDQDGKRMLPAEAGTTDTSVLDKNDVIATIFDLAIRKYLKIENDPKDKKKFTFKKLKNFTNDSSLAQFEKTLLGRLFEVGDSISTDDLSDFYITFSKLQDDIFTLLIGKKLYTKNPKNQRAGLIAGGIVALTTANVFLGFLLIYLGIVLNGRTEAGDNVDWRIDGLKLFLKGMSRNYKWQTEQLAIVEKMIPYAIALGYIDKFMESIKIAMPDYKPSWYSGNQPFYISSSNMFSSLNSGFVTTSPSSGFSGGSSGGGGGGGGGGSW
ncbi:DUF2207 domain-containing protein [Patescibacteria group bacterium]|nr:DUF2207 domain-containing protein [Patescibacteria group bacterium]